ncbi:MAG: hypothetical protein IKB51_02635, partial [Clostridia bacterium]|nr:hypothetical protein [Clostridia bacterium]
MKKITRIASLVLMLIMLVSVMGISIFAADSTECADGEHNFGGADLSVVNEATCSVCGMVGTRYGNIPADKADATASPVVLFDKDGNYVTSGDFLTVFAASLKTSETTVENPDNDPVYIVFRSG